jgi:5-methylcytosine-specific restriction protein B
LSRDEFAKALERLESKRNIIVEGPPGVGKTFVAEKLAYALMEAADWRRVTKVQFHPSYSYEDFVRGFRPTTVAAQFDLVDGPFLHACQAAESQPDLRHVLLIDEINRANLPRVFGELLYLLEYRDQEVMLPCSRRRFRLPSNLYLVGTMNSADRSTTHAPGPFSWRSAPRSGRRRSPSRCCRSRPRSRSDRCVPLSRSRLA